MLRSSSLCDKFPSRCVSSLYSLARREGESTSRLSCSSYIGFQSANACNSRSLCWCTKHCTISCLRIWRKIANLCLSLDADCVRWTSTRAVPILPSAANQHTSRRSLIHCCWTSRMEQSVQPSCESRTLQLGTQNASL